MIDAGLRGFDHTSHVDPTKHEYQSTRVLKVLHPSWLYACRPFYFNLLYSKLSLYKSVQNKFFILGRCVNFKIMLHFHKNDFFILFA